MFVHTTSKVLFETTIWRFIMQWKQYFLANFVNAQIKPENTVLVPVICFSNINVCVKKLRTSCCNVSMKFVNLSLRQLFFHEFSNSFWYFGNFGQVWQVGEQKLGSINEFEWLLEGFLGIVDETRVFSETNMALSWLLWLLAVSKVLIQFYYG